MFYRKRNKLDVEPISFRHNIIPIADSAKYLGILLDKRINFELNILERSSKVILALYACLNIFQKLFRRLRTPWKNVRTYYLAAHTFIYFHRYIYLFPDNQQRLGRSIFYNKNCDRHTSSSWV